VSWPEVVSRKTIGAIIVLVGLAVAAAMTRFESHESSGCELPPRDCDGPGSYCGELVWFSPPRGPGYEDDTIKGEISLPESTSYARRDLMMLIKYSAAKVACETGARPLALGDMSDRNGATPGTAFGMPHHPLGSHEDGLDIDVGYYQRGTPDNRIRAICPHELDGADHRHCVAPPRTLDAERTALFIGALFESPRVRIVGIDGAAAPPVRTAITRLCRSQRITPAACARIRLGYETADTGRFWYLGHHNHMHVSLRR
jgi:hypothetical protein